MVFTFSISDLKYPFSASLAKKIKIFCLSWNLVTRLMQNFFEERIGFDINTSFSSRLVSRLIRWYKKPGDITKEFWEKAIQFYGTFRGLKITNCNGDVQFFCFRPKISFLSKYGSKNQNCQLGWNLVPKLTRICRVQ